MKFSGHYPWPQQQGARHQSRSPGRWTRFRPWTWRPCVAATRVCHSSHTPPPCAPPTLCWRTDCCRLSKRRNVDLASRLSPIQNSSEHATCRPLCFYWEHHGSDLFILNPLYIYTLVIWFGFLSFCIMQIYKKIMTCKAYLLINEKYNFLCHSVYLNKQFSYRYNIHRLSIF